MGVSFGSGDPVGGGFAGILKTDLDVIEAGIDERLQPRLGEADAGGDEICVKAGGARSGDELGEIGAGQRFSAGEVRVQHAELAGLTENVDPLCGGKFRANGGQLQRIGAIDAVQRAAVRQFGDEGERVGNH